MCAARLHQRTVDEREALRDSSGTAEILCGKATTEYVIVFVLLIGR